MTNEWKHCSLEQAKKLVELGVVLDTESSWIVFPDEDLLSRLFSTEVCENFLKSRSVLNVKLPLIYPAPDCADILKIIPDKIAIPTPPPTRGFFFAHLLIWKTHIKAYDMDYFDEWDNPTIRHASEQDLGHMLCDRVIWLIENKHVKPEDLRL